MSLLVSAFRCRVVSPSVTQTSYWFVSRSNASGTVQFGCGPPSTRRKARLAVIQPWQRPVHVFETWYPPVWRHRVESWHPLLTWRRRVAQQRGSFVRVKHTDKHLRMSPRLWLRKMFREEISRLCLRMTVTEGEQLLLMPIVERGNGNAVCTLHMAKSH